LVLLLGFFWGLSNDPTVFFPCSEDAFNKGDVLFIKVSAYLAGKNVPIEIVLTYRRGISALSIINL
jgi:hypothetical protein